MTKRFGAFTALDDVSLHVAPGSFHALLGENGAGKSTLVKCIMGFYQPDAGQIVRRRPRAHDRARRTTPTPSASAWSTSTSRWCEHDGRREPGHVARDVPAVINWRRERERLAALHGHDAVQVDAR